MSLLAARINQILFISIFIWISPHLVWASLQVYPMKVFLDQQERGASVTVKNVLNKPLVLRVSTVYFHQNELGQMILNPEKEKPADDLVDYLRFSPRVVELQPGEFQIVRITARNTTNLSDGDYRAHLRFEEQNTFVEKPSGENQMKVGLQAKIAVSIPVFYRQGKPESKITLKNLSIEKRSESQTQFKVSMLKQGNALPYGEFKLYAVDASGARTLISEVQGVQSFVPERQFIYPVQNEKLDKIIKKSKSIVLEYKSTRTPNGDVLATTEAPL